MAHCLAMTPDCDHIFCGNACPSQKLLHCLGEMDGYFAVCLSQLFQCGRIAFCKGKQLLAQTARQRFGVRGYKVSACSIDPDQGGVNGVEAGS
jgi:hypothetical protein